ncbi:MAG: response regulator transcription factor [Caulobacteraceae bacterium]
MYSILLVDDEKTIREYLPKAIPFEKYGFTIKDTAMNGQEALDKLSTIQPDLILLDVRMPVMDGLQFLSVLRQSAFSNTLVMMLSGFSEFAYAKSAIKYGVEAYVNKPVDENEIAPLLEKIRDKLDAYYHEKRLGLARKHLKVLNNLYNGAVADRGILDGFALMTCVLLPSPNEPEHGDSHLMLQQTLTKTFSELENYLFRTVSSQYTFLIPPEIFNSFSNNKELFADHLLDTLSKTKVNCAILIDSYIFTNEERTFREDFETHLQQMLTHLFFTPVEFIDYHPDKFAISEDPYFEYKYIEEIKKHFSSGNKNELFTILNKLIIAIKEAHLRIDYIQEINYRIYYIILSEIIASDNQNQEKEILTRPEWLRYSYFISLDKWKEILFSLITDGLTFIERRYKMINLGISGKVIEYVHQHYMENIKLKQIAEKFFVNATYLGRAFQKATGVSFNQYVNHLRIAEAKKLLLHTNKMIYEIANMVGYPESKYFIVKFTQEVGKSPTEFRNQCF